MLRRCELLALLLLLNLIPGCSEDEPCGEGLEFENGTCTRETPAASGEPEPQAEVVDEPDTSADSDAADMEGAGGNKTAAPEDGASDADASPADASAAFGAPCETHEECEDPTDYCVISPVDPVHYCTASGCNEDDDRCPEEWTCFDVGQFSPGEPWICMKP